MKVAVSAAGPTMEAAVDPRFGRCPWFVVVEVSGQAFEAVENGGGELKGVAGLQAAQLVARRGARVVLTGSCGPNAQQALDATGVEVFTGCSGTVAEVVRRFAAGQLQAAAAGRSVTPLDACAHHHGRTGARSADTSAVADRVPPSIPSPATKVPPPATG